jgi:transcriptional/translational regulatory protein YebC/TACO1
MTAGGRRVSEIRDARNVSRHCLMRTAPRCYGLVDSLEDSDDVQNVRANLDVDVEILGGVPGAGVS